MMLKKQKNNSDGHWVKRRCGDFFYLGEEIKKRGHEFTVVAFFRFESFVKEHGLSFHGIHVDEELMMRLLLSECHNGTDYLKGLETLLNKDPEMLEDCYEACKDANLIIYVKFIEHADENFLHLTLILYLLIGVLISTTFVLVSALFALKYS